MFVQIVFFEMNYKIGTDSERYDVVPELRSPKIIFPSDWDPKRTRQKQSRFRMNSRRPTLTYARTR